jgi:hypothetical protein
MEETNHIQSAQMPNSTPDDDIQAYEVNSSNITATTAQNPFFTVDGLLLFFLQFAKCRSRASSSCGNG